MSIYQSFITWTLFLQVNLDIFIYSERYVQMWFLRVGNTSKSFMVDFWKMFESRKATGLLFLPQLIYWSKWCYSNGTGLRFPRPFQQNLFHNFWINKLTWVEFTSEWSEQDCNLKDKSNLNWDGRAGNLLGPAQSSWPARGGFKWGNKRSGTGLFRP